MPQNIDDFFVNVKRGTLPGKGSIFKFGRNPVADITEEIIWDNGNGYDFLTTAQKMIIVSTSAQDAPLGAGAQQIRIFGLDQNWLEITEIVQMQGLTPVETAYSYIRLNRMYVECGGTPSATINPSNAGNISATSKITSKLQALMLTGIGQTLMCIYTIPKNKTGFLVSCLFSIGQGKQAVFKLKTRDNTIANCSFRTRIIMEGYENTKYIPILTKEKLVPMEDILITSQLSSTPTVTASAFFEILTMENLPT